MIRVVISIFVSPKLWDTFEEKEGVKEHATNRLKEKVANSLIGTTYSEGHEIEVLTAWSVQFGYLNNRMRANVVFHKTPDEKLTGKKVKELTEAIIPSTLEAIALINLVQKPVVDAKTTNIFMIFE